MATSAFQQGNLVLPSALYFHFKDFLVLVKISLFVILLFAEYNSIGER